MVASTGCGDQKLEEKEPYLSNTARKEKKKKRSKDAEVANVEENTEEINLGIKQIQEQPGKIPPIVAYFSSGYDPSSRKTKRVQDTGSGEEQGPRVRVYRHKSQNKSKRLQVVVSPPSSNVEFVGSNYAGEGATRQTCVYTLGILNKETKTLKIVPIASNKIFRLEPRPRVSEHAAEEPSSVSVNTELSTAERADKARKLNNLYGTKSAINRDKRLRALNPGDNVESQELLDRKIKEAEIKKEALESTSDLVARNIPPHNSAALTPQEAYPLEQIIFKGEWDFLGDIYKHLEDGAEPLTDAYPIFVRNRMYKLREIEDETEKKKRARIFSFITHLIKFKDTHSLDGYSSAKNHRFPGILRQRFKNLFVDSESKRLTDDKRNLLISYVLVLTLYADEFWTDPSDIAKDLRMSPVSLRKLLENLGCKFSRQNTVLFATLPVPLKFPTVRQKRRRQS